MNSKCFWLAIMSLGAFFSCKGPEGLPSPSEMPFDASGAYISLENYARQFTRGELIAADEQGVYILVENIEKRDGGTIHNKELQKVGRQDIKAFAVYYAMGKDQNWRIPVYTLGTLSHGWWLLFTLPLNLIATSASSNASKKEYSLRDKEITVDDLWKYARFPQGIPDSVLHESIK